MGCRGFAGTSGTSGGPAHPPPHPPPTRQGPFPKKMVKRGAFAFKHFEAEGGGGGAPAFALLETDAATGRPARRLLAQPRVEADFAARLVGAEGDKRGIAQARDGAWAGAGRAVGCGDGGGVGGVLSLSPPSVSQSVALDKPFLHTFSLHPPHPLSWRTCWSV